VSSGAKVVTAFIRETTPGVTPTVGVWDLLRRASFGLAPTQNTNDNDEIGGDRMAQGVSRGTIDVGGDVGTNSAGTSTMLFWRAALVLNG
jgi:hypothetical protein